jgi:8-oxo-dGTP pyrophosphatase MutT (NUDIX family)
MFKNVPNKSYKTTCGKTIWHSRNVAVAVLIIRANPEDESKLQIIGVKRGPKVTNTGQWCFPCGYLDWNENVEEAAVREVFEETNINLDISDLDFYNLDSDPAKNLQNVSVHFSACVNKDVDIHGNNCEAGEVDEVRWINIEDIEDYEWAFDHKIRALNFLKHVK